MDGKYQHLYSIIAQIRGTLLFYIEWNQVSFSSLKDKVSKLHKTLNESRPVLNFS